jgi:hypothetical protein
MISDTKLDQLGLNAPESSKMYFLPRGDLLKLLRDVRRKFNETHPWELIYSSGPRKGAKTKMYNGVGWMETRGPDPI